MLCILPAACCPIVCVPPPNPPAVPLVIPPMAPPAPAPARPDPAAPATGPAAAPAIEAATPTPTIAACEAVWNRVPVRGAKTVGIRTAVKSAAAATQFDIPLMPVLAKMVALQTGPLGASASTYAATPIAIELISEASIRP